MHRRVQVEVEWFIALSDAGFAEFAAAVAGRAQRLRERVTRFSVDDAQAIKDIERTTNHDVKAVEYWLKHNLQRRCRAGARRRVRALRLHQRGHQQHQPCADAEGRARRRCCCRRSTASAQRLTAMAHEFADVPMLSRTHGQTASPTTLGKEIANVAARIGHGAPAHRRGAAAGQDERRGRQLQRPPGGLPRLRLGGVRAPRGRAAA